MTLGERLVAPVTKCLGTLSGRAPGERGSNLLPPLPAGGTRMTIIPLLGHRAVDHGGGCGSKTTIVKLGSAFAGVVRRKKGFGRGGKFRPLPLCPTARFRGQVGTGKSGRRRTAIALGGPGAVFWMWITALFGMALAFAEGSLAIRIPRTHLGRHLSRRTDELHHARTGAEMDLAGGGVLRRYRCFSALVNRQFDPGQRSRQRFERIVRLGTLVRRRGGWALAVFVVIHRRDQVRSVASRRRLSPSWPPPMS